jgi:hypothetical protein
LGMGGAAEATRVQLWAEHPEQKPGSQACLLLALDLPGGCWGRVQPSARSFTCARHQPKYSNVCAPSLYILWEGHSCRCVLLGSGVKLCMRDDSPQCLRAAGPVLQKGSGAADDALCLLPSLVCLTARGRRIPRMHARAYAPARICRPSTGPALPVGARRRGNGLPALHSAHATFSSSGSGSRSGNGSGSNSRVITEGDAAGIERRAPSHGGHGPVAIIGLRPQ